MRTLTQQPALGWSWITDAAPGLQQSRSKSKPGAFRSQCAGRDGREEAASCLASSVLVKGRGHSSVEGDGAGRWGC